MGLLAGAMASVPEQEHSMTEQRLLMHDQVTMVPEAEDLHVVSQGVGTSPVLYKGD